MNNITKQDLRNLCRQKRQKLFNDGHIEKISTEICSKISKSAVYKNAKNIMLFYPKAAELNVLKLLDIQSEGKNFYLPRCKENSISVCPYKGCDKLILNNFNIEEPITEPISDVEILDIIIAPALCADKRGNRLGYGKGFYDRFFSNPKLRAKKIVIIPEILLFKTIPADIHDKKCNFIVTEKQLLELA